MKANVFQSGCLLSESVLTECTVFNLISTVDNHQHQKAPINLYSINLAMSFLFALGNSSKLKRLTCGCNDFQIVQILHFEEICLCNRGNEQAISYNVLHLSSTWLTLFSDIINPINLFN